MPVEGTREIHPEAGTSGPSGVVEFGDQVAARPSPHRVEPGGGGVPQAEALVVLGGGDDVAPTRGHQFLHEVAGVEGLGPPHIRQVLIAGARAVQVLVTSPRGAARDPHGIAVPLRVLVVGVSLLDGYGAPPVGSGPCRNRVQTPVDEESQLRVAVPLRHPLGGVGGGVGAEVRAGAGFEVQHHGLLSGG